MTETAYKTIETANKDGIFTLTLNNPPLNILNIAMLDEITAAVAEAAGCGFLFLEAKGKAFSAGADVGEHMPDKAAKMLSSFHKAIKALAAFEGLVIAKVQGAALGGGCELVLPADIVLASAKAKFGQPEIQLGVYPPVAMVLLPELCGPAAARELIYTGKSVRAEEARMLGIVSAVFDPENFEAESAEYLARFKSLSRSSLIQTKRALRKIHPSDFERKLDIAEKAYLQELMKTADGKEGCAAFLEKRKPSWRHA